MDLEKIISDLDQETLLQVALGTELLLQIDGVESNVKSSFVGMQPQVYLATTIPKISGITGKLFEGNQVIVRYLFAGTVYGFQSNILGHTRQPFPLMFLSFPKLIARRELRKEARVDCHLPAELMVKGQACSGALVDLSPSGCRFAAVAYDKKTSPRIDSGTKMALSFHLPGSAEAYGVSGKACGRTSVGGIMMVGFKFDGLDQDQASAVGACVTMAQEYAQAKSAIAEMR